MSNAPSTCPNCHAPLTPNSLQPGKPTICGRCGATVPPPVSPFAGVGPYPANPYAPPAGNPFADSPAVGYFPPAYDPATIRNMARAKVNGPAILLIVVGALMVLLALTLIGLGVMMFLETGDEEAVIVGVVLGVCALLCLGSSGVLIIAGLRMRQLRSYGLAMTATVLTMGVGLMTCVPMALAGVWPLVVLLDAQVKQAFYLPPEGDS